MSAASMSRYGRIPDSSLHLWIAIFCLSSPCGVRTVHSQTVDALAPEVRKYLNVATPKAVLEHVRVIDGTGAKAKADQNIVIESGKITAIGPRANLPRGDGVTTLDLQGYSVMPGIVDMHGHLWAYARPNMQPDGKYERPGIPTSVSFSAPRLYLANGVTTMRTAGSIAPQRDVNLKKAIEAGHSPGPHLDVTGPYFLGPGDASLQAQNLADPNDARATVAFWADHGVTSFKAYGTITGAELRAVVEEAHKRGLKVLGHLCSVTYEEAAEIGIDSLEHGFFVNTALDPDKKPDTCTDSRGDYTLEHMSADQANHLIGMLIEHHVAVTSTLPNTASYAPSLNVSENGQPPISPGALAAMSPGTRDAFLIDLKQPNGPDQINLFRRDVELERAFVAAGGLLMAGSDPVGLRGLVPGFADHREIELLVDGGFTPLQAIQIATLNGAKFLGRQDQIGSIAVGKHADLMVVRGEPSTHIADIEKVEIVFKDGAGYDTRKLLDSADGHYGEF